ncbi:MAG: vWA domain-containing protein [Polyangiales bacterium]
MAYVAARTLLGLGLFMLNVDCGGLIGAAPSDAGGDGPTIDSGISSAEVGVPPPRDPTKAITKVDLLLVVDNSSSMADKQSELARQVPAIIATLTGPFAKSPPLITDLHVGVITTSLGSFGTDACDESQPGNEYNDRAHLLPRNPTEASGSGFVVGPDGATTAAACPTLLTSSAITWAFGSPFAAQATETATSCVVQSAHEDGCGYEATWESLYHFLIDPKPYLTATTTCSKAPGGVTCDTDIQATGVDTALLDERAAFLRPDSVLAVVILSDENDASLAPAGANWVFWGLPGGTSSHDSSMPRGWSTCANLPDDLEPANSRDLAARGCNWCYNNSNDPQCTVSWESVGSTDWDQRNLRAFEQSRRFGINGLYPRQRYVDAFTRIQVPGSDGILGTNGIYAGGQRSADMVVLTAIVGTPEALVANPTSHQPKVLGNTDWDMLVSPNHAVRDPHMIESITPRAGIATFRPSTTPDLQAIPIDFADPVNGGDRDIAQFYDLQYACIGIRSTTIPDSRYSDCAPSEDTDRTSPLCGSGGSTQPRFKAYPGLRHLRILHEISLMGIGVTTIAGSICAPTYGPLATAIGEGIAHAAAPPTR